MANFAAGVMVLMFRHIKVWTHTSVAVSAIASSLLPVFSAAVIY